MLKKLRKELPEFNITMIKDGIIVAKRFDESREDTFVVQVKNTKSVSIAKMYILDGWEHRND